MKTNLAQKTGDNPEYAYHLLRGALEKFQKNVDQLDEQQYQQARKLADRTCALETIVLSSPEACDVVIPENKIEEAVAEVRSRYADEPSFQKDLASNGLDESILRSALHRELMFDAVMNRVTSKTPSVSDIDVQIFYQLHKDRFTRPEKRKARHILITINPDFAENDRESAQERINTIAEKLQRSPGRFESLARRYSECPTAMEGGRLGDLVRGTLYPELDDALFEMEEDQISDVIESDIGFHILWCEKISKPITVPLSRAKPRIQQLLQERQRKACQKAWLDKLQEDNHDG